MQQKDCQTDVTKPTPIGLGSYYFDNHGSGVYLVKPGLVNYEGTFGKGVKETVPYEIPYECLLPNEFDNLFVSVCASATQVAMCSMRMEPQYMIMGEAAGCAAAHVATKTIPSFDVAPDISSMLEDRGAKVRL